MLDPVFRLNKSYFIKACVSHLYTSVFSLIKKDSIKLPGWVSSGTFKILGALKLEENFFLKNRASNS